jgi:hypothetical protein
MTKELQDLKAQIEDLKLKEYSKKRYLSKKLLLI